MVEALARRVRMSFPYQPAFFSKYQSEVPYLVTKKAQIVANTHGGAQRSSVTVELYPSVAVNVGKKALKLNEMTMLDNASARYQTRQSLIAMKNPCN